MRHISLVLPAISGDHWKERVEATLKRFDGVKDAIVDVANKRVALTYDPDRVQISELEAALSEVDYDVTG